MARPYKQFVNRKPTDYDQLEHQPQSFILVKLKGTFVSETVDDICFNVQLSENYSRKDFFPKSRSWYKQGDDFIEIHKDLAKKKGYIV